MGGPLDAWGDHKIPMPHWGDHQIPIPFEVWETIRVILQGDHKSHIRHEDTSHVGGPYVHVGEQYDTCSI